MPKPSKNLQKNDVKKETTFSDPAWCTARPPREDPEPNKHNILSTRHIHLATHTHNNEPSRETSKGDFKGG